MNKFKLLVDTSLLDFIQSTDEQYKKKFVLSYLNDFESGQWRYDVFNNFVFDSLCETALSASEREKLIGEPMTLLNQAAKT